MSKEKVEKLNFFKNGGVCGNSSNGASGGVAIFWNKKTISGEMIDVDGNILSLKAKSIFDGKECVITNIYAPNSKSARSKFWEEIQQKRKSFPLDSWVVMGDFNTPLQDINKYGGIHA